MPLPHTIIARHHHYQGDCLIPGDPAAGIPREIVPTAGLVAIHVRYLDESGARLDHGGLTLVGDGQCFGLAICSLDDEYVPSRGVAIACGGATRDEPFGNIIPRYLPGRVSGRFRLRATDELRQALQGYPVSIRRGVAGTLLAAHRQSGGSCWNGWTSSIQGPAMDILSAIARTYHLTAPAEDDPADISPTGSPRRGVDADRLDEIHQLLVDAADWRSDDSAGLSSAIPILCDLEDAVRDLLSDHDAEQIAWRLLRHHDEDWNDFFERIAHWFHAETGYLRPGKSQPAACCGTPTDEQREVAFTAWLDGKLNRLGVMYGATTGADE